MTQDELERFEAGFRRLPRWQQCLFLIYMIAYNALAKLIDRVKNLWVKNHR